MILLDANLLIYAIDRDSPNHEAASSYINRLLSTTQEVGFAWVVLLAFLRITTHRRVLVRPLLPREALEYVESWLAQPYATLVTPGTHHWPILRNLVELAGSTGNLTTDSHLAALAIEHGAILASADNDFRRFPGLRYANPLLDGAGR